MKTPHIILLFCLLGLTLAACAAAPQPAPTEITQSAPVAAALPVLTIMTHDSFAVTEALISRFEKENQVKLSFIKSGDTGAALNRAILSKRFPMADVFYGVDNTFLSRALSEDLFEAYTPAQLKDIAAEFKIDSSNRALPVDYGDVCINYDQNYFKSKGITIPQTLEDLLKPEYRGLLVVQNPATSSPGLAFLLTTIAHFGEDKYLDYWKSLRQNGVVIVNDWESAYYTNFSGSSGKGSQPMVVSYNSSPVAEVIFATTPVKEAPTGSIVESGMCFRQIEFVGILKNTQQRPLAEKFIDFMLSTDFQADMPGQMFVFPVNQQAKLPEAFTQYAVMPVKPATLPPNLIATQREKWIKDWDETVLR